MDTYLEKVTLTVTTSSGTLYGTAASTKAYSGYIHAVYMAPYSAGEALNANSSSYWQLRASSTTGRVLCRSSSGISGTRYWYPRHALHSSTAGKRILNSSGGNTWLVDRPMICRETINFIKICGNTSAGAGTSEGSILTVFIEGVHP